jgi:hypothetical protein
MNQLKMDIQSIQTLTGLSWSQCKIARELRIDREAVGPVPEDRQTGGRFKPEHSPTGSDATPGVDLSEG